MNRRAPRSPCAPALARACGAALRAGRAIHGARGRRALARWRTRSPRTGCSGGVPGSASSPRSASSSGSSSPASTNSRPGTSGARHPARHPRRPVPPHQVHRARGLHLDRYRGTCWPRASRPRATRCWPRSGTRPCSGEYDIAAPSAEGYLAPDTYTVAAHSSGREVVTVLLDQFHARLGSGVGPQSSASRRLTRHQALTLASIVEGEARVDEERPVIAAVYLNRMRIGMPLQADPTVQYAIQTADRRAETPAHLRRLSHPVALQHLPHRGPSPRTGRAAPADRSIEAVMAPAVGPVPVLRRQRRRTAHVFANLRGASAGRRSQPPGGAVRQQQGQIAHCPFQR